MRKLLIIFTLLPFLLMACGEDKIQTIDAEPDENGAYPDYESWNTEVIFSELGKVKAVLETDHLRKYEEKKLTFLKGVKIDFYDEEGFQTTKLTSKRGRVDDVTKNMFAIDSVVVVSDSGVVLRTEELTWQNQTGKITTDKFVRITSPEETIEGYGFESDQGLDNYKIFKITYSAITTDTSN